MGKCPPTWDNFMVHDVNNPLFIDVFPTSTTPIHANHLPQRKSSTSAACYGNVYYQLLVVAPIVKKIINAHRRYLPIPSWPIAQLLHPQSPLWHLLPILPQTHHLFSVTYIIYEGLELDA
jgi:hypothetical protein